MEQLAQLHPAAQVAVPLAAAAVAITWLFFIFRG